MIPSILSIVLVLAAASTPSAETPRSVASENAASSSKTTRTATDSEGSRAMTLDAITIEGEIDVPRVLFIGARDHLRATEPKHAIYLRDPFALIERRPVPTVVAPPKSAPEAGADSREN